MFCWKKKQTKNKSKITPEFKVIVWENKKEIKSVTVGDPLNVKYDSKKCSNKSDF
jgi:hypothetical protein